ncbi:MAG: hypothetical protein ABSA22_01410, partial [Acidimicrobiales bacterium]
MERWTRLVIKRRVIVISIWIVVTLLGALSATRLTDLLTTSLTVPGTSSAQANVILIHHFDENVEGTFTVVVPYKDATGAEIASLEAKVGDAASHVPTGTVGQERAVAGLLYANINTSLDLGQAANVTNT